MIKSKTRVRFADILIAIIHPLEAKSRRRKAGLSLTGFTLVEIMIVVAILAVLAAITIPNFIRTRIVASETAALANCRSINSACQLYLSQNNTYPNDFSDLVPPNSTPAYIDTEIADGEKQGYDFDYALTSAGTFTLNANPSAPAFAAFQRHFFMDQTGVIRFKLGAPAGANDEIVN